MQIYLNALFVILAVAVVAWLFSIVKRDVSFVDSLWSLFFLIAAGVFALADFARDNLVVAPLDLYHREELGPGGGLPLSDHSSEQ
jgi:steroid 5-alpha reductase family enzyme